MSDKRFTCYYERGNEVVIENNGKRLSNKQLVDLLNEFETKCHKLKEEIKLLKPTNIEQYEQIVQLQKENEQLKEELNNLKKDETMLYHYYTLARYGGDGV